MSLEKQNLLLKYSKNSFFISIVMFVLGGFSLFLVNNSYQVNAYNQGIVSNITGTIFWAFVGFSFIVIGCTFIIIGFWCRLKLIDLS